MQSLTLLIATAEQARCEFLAHQLDADGHTIHLADSADTTTAKLAAHAIDVALLGDLDSAADAPALLRSLRAGQLNTRIHPAQPVVTIGDGSELATVRAYEAGSDQHVARDSSYLVIRAVIDAVARRTLAQITSRHLHVAGLHIDTAARTVEIAGRPVKLSRTEFELLCTLASDPTRAFSKSELMDVVWGYKAPARSRTLDSHVCRLRGKLAGEGGDGLIAVRWGHGYTLLPTE